MRACNSLLPLLTLPTLPIALCGFEYLHALACITACYASLTPEILIDTGASALWWTPILFHSGYNAVEQKAGDTKTLSSGLCVLIHAPERDLRGEPAL